MADAKISALTSAATPLAGTEVIPIVQNGTTKKVANNDLRPKQIQSNATSGVMQIVGPAASATSVMTIPNANFTVARTDAAQTFTGAQTFQTSANTLSVKGTTYVTGSTSYGPAGNQFTGSGFLSIPIRVGDTVTAIYGQTRTVTAVTDTVVTVSSNFGISWAGDTVAGSGAPGIDFSNKSGAAGMTSQLLNWYEEGTWTPTVSAISGAYTTVSVAQGSYTRIGRQVTLRFNFTVSDKGTGANGFVISGLPFTANGGSYSGSGFNASNATGTVLYGVSMSTQFEGYRYDGTDPVVVNQSQVGVITYFV